MCDGDVPYDELQLLAAAAARLSAPPTVELMAIDSPAAWDSEPSAALQDGEMGVTAMTDDAAACEGADVAPHHISPGQAAGQTAALSTATAQRPSRRR